MLPYLGLFLGWGGIEGGILEAYDLAAVPSFGRPQLGQHVYPELQKTVRTESSE